MTVQTNTNVASFNGNGVTQIFPIAFKFNNDTDLVVLLIDDETGASSQLTLNSDYTVSGEGDEEGGLINVVVAPAAGQRLKVTRLVDILQLMDLRNQGKFFAEVHEDAFDLLTMIAQQHESGIRSAIRVAESDPEPARLPAAQSRAGQLMGFDEFGNPIAVAPTSGDSADLALNLANNTDPAKGAAMIGRSYRSIPTIADLRTTVGRYDGDQAFLLGHTQPGYGSGPWRWDASSVAADNDGTVVGSGAGRWVRQTQIPCSYDFGALPGVDATAATNAMLSSLSTFATCRINAGLTHNGTINIVRDGTCIVGDGKYSARVKFLHPTKSISVQAEYVHLERGGWIGPVLGTFGSGHVLFSDDRTTGTADFDLDIESSFVGMCGKLVVSKGRGVKIKDSDVTYVSEGVLEITPSLEAAFVPGSADFAQYQTAFRSFNISGNRMHEVYGPLVINKGNNASNVRGFLISGNLGDAKAKMWDGYMRDVVFSGNNFNYMGSNLGGTTLFAATGIDNVQIYGNFAGMEAFTNAGGTAYAARSIEYGIICSGPCNGLKVDATYKNLVREFALLQGGGSNIDMTLNGNRPTASTDGAVVTLTTAAFDGLKISGMLKNTTPASKFIPIRRAGSISVSQHNLSGLVISGGNFLKHNFVAAQAAEQGTYSYGYTGNGGTLSIDTPFPPKSIQFFYGSPQTSAMAHADFSLAGVTLTATGFTVTGNLNTSGAVYKFIAS